MPETTWCSIAFLQPSHAVMRSYKARWNGTCIGGKRDLIATACVRADERKEAGRTDKCTVEGGETAEVGDDSSLDL